MWAFHCSYLCTVGTVSVYVCVVCTKSFGVVYLCMYVHVKHILTYVCTYVRAYHWKREKLFIRTYMRMSRVFLHIQHI